MLDGLTLAIFSSIFVGKMCIFVSRPMKIVTFLRKNGYTLKRVVDFPLERDTFRNKITEIVENFDVEFNCFLRSRCSMEMVVVVVRSVVSQVSKLHRCDVCATTQLDNFVLKTSQRTVRTSTSQRSHLLSCEHSWAEQTTGSRTMRLRERIHTNQEKT